MSAFNLITGKASLNSDLIIEYEKENQIMFSHCGGGPFSCASKMSDIILDRQYEVKSGLGVYYPVKTGGKEVTIINLVVNELTYRMCILSGTSVALDKLTYFGNPINVKFMSVVLIRKGGYEVVVSEDVEEIQQLARSGAVAAIIMDISLTHSIYEGKKVDGLFITRLLKNDPSTSQVPVMLATAHAMFGDRERFMSETGAEHYVSKPIHDPGLFLQELRVILPEGP